MGSSAGQGALSRRTLCHLRSVAEEVRDREVAPPCAHSHNWSPHESLCRPAGECGSGGGGADSQTSGLPRTGAHEPGREVVADVYEIHDHSRPCTCRGKITKPLLYPLLSVGSVARKTAECAVPGSATPDLRGRNVEKDVRKDVSGRLRRGQSGPWAGIRIQTRLPGAGLLGRELQPLNQTVGGSNPSAGTKPLS